MSLCLCACLPWVPSRSLTSPDRTAEQHVRIFRALNGWCVRAQLDPCYPPGWVGDDGRLGHGNFTMCREVAGKLLASNACKVNYPRSYYGCRWKAFT
eukprot:scaffold15854_cov32-Prasinocladus_malaysianus.AAC.1